jgi:hypothetical protein
MAARRLRDLGRGFLAAVPQRLDGGRRLRSRPERCDRGAVAERLREIVEAEYDMGAFLLTARTWAAAGIATGLQELTPTTF